MGKIDQTKAVEKKRAEEAEQIKEVETNVTEDKQRVCGIIMPISPIDGCSADHWKQVKDLLSEAINEAGFKPSLVSDSDDSGIIQKRIVQNIYDNEIVVCDVSGKNPNVMFELGMRLAFDKPTIIVIDDKTGYSFDTSPIEHLQYPRDLSYYSIMDFKNKLKGKIIATIDSSKDPNYTTFLKHFGEFEIAHVERKKGSIDDVVLSRLEDLTLVVSNLNRRVSQIRDVQYTGKSKIQLSLIKELVRREIDNYCDFNNIEKDIAYLNIPQLGIESIADKLLNYPEILAYFGSKKSLIDFIDKEIMIYGLP